MDYLDSCTHFDVYDREMMCSSILLNQTDMVSKNMEELRCYAAEETVAELREQLERSRATPSTHNTTMVNTGRSITEGSARQRRMK